MSDRLRYCLPSAGFPGNRRRTNESTPSGPWTGAPLPTIPTLPQHHRTSLSSSSLTLIHNSSIMSAPAAFSDIAKATNDVRIC